MFGEIGVETSEIDLQRLEPSFVYEDFEETFQTEKGAFITTDPISKEAMWISVYIKELDDEDFDEANW